MNKYCEKCYLRDAKPCAECSYCFPDHRNFKPILHIPTNADRVKEQAMERLTQRLNDQNGNPTNTIIVDYSIVHKTKEEQFELLKERLAAYEDKGLKPQEIISLIGEWNACRHALDSCRAELEAAMGRINAAYEIAQGCNIPSPTIPEYVELHEGMTRIMNALRV